MAVVMPFVFLNLIISLDYNTSVTLCRPQSPARGGSLKHLNRENEVMSFTLYKALLCNVREGWKGQGWRQEGRAQEGCTSRGHRRAGRGDWSLNQGGGSGTGRCTDFGSCS